MNIEKAKKVLTHRELEYLMIMNANAGTLFVQGPPGGGKSAILKNIANKMNFNYIPLDAPAMDELDLGLMPHKTEVNGQLFVEGVPPMWAALVMQSERPSLIVVEEMNRNLKLVNALLNILNEKRIGYVIDFYKAKSPVFIAGTGNMGGDDGAVVDELDAAQMGRLVIKYHIMAGAEGVREWETAFAGVPHEGRPNGYVLPQIRKYLHSNPQDFAPDLKNTDKAREGSQIRVTGRRWTYLNDFLINNFGYDINNETLTDAVKKYGPDYIGTRALGFAKWLDAVKRVTVKDILSGKTLKAERENAAELIEAFKAMSWPKTSKKMRENVYTFIKGLDSELCLSAVYELSVMLSAKLHENKDSLFWAELRSEFKDNFNEEIQILKNADK
jgi:hypothetical protein